MSEHLRHFALSDAPFTLGIDDKELWLPPTQSGAVVPGIPGQVARGCSLFPIPLREGTLDRRQRPAVEDAVRSFQTLWRLTHRAICGEPSIRGMSILLRRIGCGDV